MTNEEPIFIPCEFAGCPNAQYYQGLCPAHSVQQKRGVELQPIGVLYYRPEVICSELGCKNIRWSGGKCRGHYLQEYRGNPTKPVRQNIPFPCSSEGCTRTAVTKGYCSPHYNKKVQREQERKCDFPGCGRPHESHGLCKTHSGQKRKGKELTAIRDWGTYVRGTSPCGVESCPKAATTAGYCAKHISWATQYHMTIEMMNDFYIRGKCDICGETRRLCIDHDHGCCPDNSSCGKCIRGLLCGWCNNSLGHARDNPEILRKLAVYLESR